MTMSENASTTRKDPLPVFCFKVSLNLSGAKEGEAFFKSVGGLKYEAEVIPIREGGVNDTTFQIPGAVKWSNIVLKQGFTGSSALLTWRQQWLTGTMTRVNGTIQQLNTKLVVMATWKFFAGWPVKWEISEFDASKSELAIESLEIAHHGILFGA
jgi:phage tail-like protein